VKLFQHLGKLVPRRLLLNPMRVVITEFKERIKLLKEPKEALKKNSYPEGKPYCCRIELALQGEIV